MRAAFAVLALVLTSCAQVPPPSHVGFRDVTAPIGGTTRFDPARFAGDWYVVSTFGDVSVRKQTFAFDTASGMVTGPTGETYRSNGPGVLTPVNPGTGERFVIMWIDEDFRTAAIGTPSGSDAVILDRKPHAAPDRLAAAKDILSWYGWDLTKLKEVTP